ncbi:MAG: histidine phosphatase family protein [Thiocapsa sp.]|jgi:broad specificity phosphatase PhoE|nr:histidine phosphatase family protein [Thiocapsa sp.]MCG6897546.1 histidine phosphatase family protein [Thiocapsa sp.]MCG6985484.1 histidine phosphatase family protein [Thiocapsa sp.]
MSDRFLDLLRHGEAQRGARFRGGHDDPLSADGWEQMRRATARDPGWTRVVCSPARRCREPAQHLAAGLDLPVSIVPALRERAFGGWEGLAVDQIPLGELTRFWDDPVGYTPPGAEPFPAFRQRVLAAWGRVCGEAGHFTLILTHGGVIRVVLAELLRMPPEATILIEVPPACLTRVRMPAPPGRASLMRHGCR